METDPVMLRLMLDTLASIPEEMGRVLKRTAYSPNIKERMDASCALFDGRGGLVAQAEHIPVHLGSMPLVVKSVLETGIDFSPGDIVMVNDPATGGTHLPDITVIMPVFHRGKRVGFVVNRAHHSDIGGITPGSMPASSITIFQEGLIIPPVKVVKEGRENTTIVNIIASNTRTPQERIGDLRAQISACRLGERRVMEMIERYGRDRYDYYLQEVKDYSYRLTKQRLKDLPRGEYSAEERIELNRCVNGKLEEGVATIHLTIRVFDGKIIVDFNGTDPELKGNLNTPFAVTLSAVYYVFRCLTGADIPNNEGCYRDIMVTAPKGCLLNPHPGRAVCAGNVETSQRIVEALFTALYQALPNIVPASSQGTMNNLIIGGDKFSYYETLGGGEGAYPWRNGESGIHTHMTNTANTPIEALEMSYPLRVEEYSLIDGSGGAGRYRGGDGIRRRIRILTNGAYFSLLSNSRYISPQGRNGGEAGRTGRNLLIRGEKEIMLPSLVEAELKAGDVVVIETPGGGGWGKKIESNSQR